MSWLRYARYFCPYLLQLTPNDQTLFFFLGFITCHACLEGYCWLSEAVGDHKGHCNWRLWEGYISFSLSYFLWIVDYILAILHTLYLEGELVVLSFGALIMSPIGNGIIQALSVFTTWHFPGVIWGEKGTIIWNGMITRSFSLYIGVVAWEFLWNLLIIFYVPGQHSCMVHCGYQAWKLVCSFGHTTMLFSWDVFSWS